MQNRIVGFLVIGMAALMGLVIFVFNRALTKIVNTSCSHGPTCPMWGTIDFQTNVSLGIMAFVVLIGLYLVFLSREEKIVTKIKRIREQVQPKKITKESYQKIMAAIAADEKRVLEMLIEAQGSLLQSELVDKSGFGKVKVTRILDKLGGKGIIERKRRGMTNVVQLKQ
jgi:predicted transcriptional regulator